MLFNLWKFIQLLLPYWLVIRIYRYNKAIPANIKTRSGRTLKAIMVTDKYGIIFTNEEYIENRTKKLREKQMIINAANEELSKEINSLSFQTREEMFAEDLISETSGN